MFNSATPFVTILSPIVAIPIILGVLVGLFGCAEIVAGAYGFDLAAAFPLLHIENNIAAPIILFGATLFAMAFMAKAIGWLPPAGDPQSWGYKTKKAMLNCCLILILISILSVPYWWHFPAPEAFVVTFAIIAWFGYKKLSISPAQA